MKKLCLCLTVLAALLFFAGCGGSKKENKNETPDSEETVTDGDAVDTEPGGDTEPSGDTEPTDNPDTTPEPTDTDDPDTTPEPTDTDDPDTTPEPTSDDDADTMPEQDPCDPNPCVNFETSNGECSPISETEYSCGCNEGDYWDKDTSVCKKAPDYTGLYWSERTEEKMTTADATAYCENLEEDGFTDWELPTIEELRTLVKNCEGLMPGGQCKISKYCNSLSCVSAGGCYCPESSEEGYYSIFGDDEALKSQTTAYSGDNWCINFNHGSTAPVRTSKTKVRCVRHACEEGKVWDKNTKSCVTPETRTESCGTLPVEHSEWNTVSEIPQTWNSYSWNWEPPVNTRYNETPSDTECRYKCIKDYNWTGEACTFDDFPECSETSKTPCYYKGFIWSKKAPQTKDNDLGSYYCNSLDEGLINDWDLPNIDTLRTLLKAERVAAECKVTEDPYCLSQENCWSCSTCTETGTPSSDDSYCSNWGTSYSDGRYSVFGDNGIFWSSSAYSGSKNWAVDFSLGRVYEDNSEVEHYLRCAIPYSTAIAQCISTGGTWNAGYNYCQTLKYKCGKMGGNWDSSTETCSRTAICTDKPTNSSWNTESSITQTYNGEDWLPSNTSTHSEIASSSECYFKCDYGYFWTGSECAVSPCNSNSCSALEGFSYTSCKPTSTTEYLCGGKDASTGYIWSAKAQGWYTWDEAVSYCDNLVEDYSDNWRLPTISELRTLVLNCVGSVPGGECGVVDTGNPSTSCLASSCETSGGYCGGCPATAEHSKFSDTSEFWSSSTVTDASTSVWLLHFTYATIYSKGAPNRNQVRCIRN